MVEMLNITKAKRSERWVDGAIPTWDESDPENPKITGWQNVEGERYLIRFTSTFRNLRDFFEIAKEIIVDWEGVIGADNKPLPCTDAILAEFVRTDEGTERLRYLMFQAASQKGFTRIEELLKNSIAPFVGQSTGQGVAPNGAKNASESANLQNHAPTAH